MKRISINNHETYLVLIALHAFNEKGTVSTDYKKLYDKFLSKVGFRSIEFESTKTRRINYGKPNT